ncbi:hypothetical protein AcV7_003589 [Taiwanofungus camphoratus]|nr:hypothetical protein AcV7_003589 [Antrodia cinnamomea]
MVSVAYTMPNLAGQVIDDGRYELVELLGAGAYGVVYRAIDHQAPSSSSNTTPVQRAVKIIRKAGPLKSDTTRQRREISLHRHVSKHRNVVTLHDAFEDSTFYYLVMDYCPGGDLFGYICESGMFYRNDELVRKVFLQILDAVHSCHETKVYHRDLKPENILCNADCSEVYISDFGLATDRQLSYTFGCGSSYYMSPEVIGEEFGFTSYSSKLGDVWALGIILVNIVTGRNPWEIAKTQDPCFSNFLIEENYFRRMLPISQGANDIFRKIFTINPLHRISLPELREAVLNLDTFFMNEEELAKASAHVHMAVDSYDISASLDARANSVLRDDIYTEECDDDISMEEVDLSTLDPDEYLYDDLEAGVVSQPPRAKTPLGQRLATQLIAASRRPSQLTTSSAPGWASASTTTSGYESAGPATPGVYAHDPKIEVPELAEGEGLGEALLPPPALAKKSPGSSSPALQLLGRLGLIAFS